MTDFLSLHLIVRAVTGIILLLCIWAFVRVMNAANTLEWSDLVSALGRDGKQHASWNNIGQGCGVIICVWLPTIYAYSPKMEAVGLAAVMGVSLLYLGGVSAYAANLRAKQGSVTTVTEPVPDPVPDPVPSKVTVVEAAPVAPKPTKGKR